MAVTKYTGTYGDYYANGSLSTAQQEANVLYIGKYLLAKKWTLNAIAGLCGNIESECHFNPGGKEVGGTGYGLIQWTPGTIHSEWCNNNGYDDPTTMDANLAHIVWEAENDESWYQKGDYKLSYKDFTTSNESAYFLAGAFCWNRERPAVSLWGFHRGMKGDAGIDHTNYHLLPSASGRTYCSKTAYDSSCEANCIAYKYCYYNNFGATKTSAQVDKNQASLKKTRGDQADKWFNFLLKNFFKKIPKPGEKGSESIYKKSYYVSSIGFSGLNYNNSIEKWPGGCGKTQAELEKLGIWGTGTVLPNCTSWTWGRAYEIIGQEPKRFSGDAGNWWNYFDDNKKSFEDAGYKKSSKPVLGAIACWQDPNNPSSMGHVAIVEEVFDDGKISISESGWNWWSLAPYFYTVTEKINPSAYNTKYDFMGYITLPGYSSAFTEPPTIESFKFKEAATEEASFIISVKDEGGSLSGSYYSLNGKKVGNLSLKAGDNTFTIKKLAPNTKYSITVTLEADTETVASSAVEFTTKQDYPDPIKDITIISTGKNLENVYFTASIEEPARWGYWKTTAKNDYGYRVFIVEDSKLLNNFDSEITKTLTIKPSSKGVLHGTNFQVGISAWVTDDNDQKVFAEPGKDYPVCSNSIILKDVSEISDTCYSLINDEIHKVHVYMKASSSKSFKPTNIFKV